MGEKDRASLLAYLAARYEELARRLSHRLGSAVSAADALQGTYVRIGQAEAIPAVTDHQAYLLRVATNLAADEHRAHQRQRLDDIDIRKLLEIADDTPGPAAIVESRLTLAILTEALAELPEQCRAVFVAARLDDTPHLAIAKQYGISVRTVANEIQRALSHCADRLEKNSR